MQAVAPIRNHHTRQVLSLDGGGIRGIVSSKILSVVLAQMGNLQVHEVFDLVAGTSTGSLIAAACLLPDPNNPSQPKYTAAKVADIMVTKGPQVFHETCLRKIVTGYGVFEPKYDNRGILSVIESLGDDYLSNLMTDVWFPSTVKNNLSSIYFTRQKARSLPDWKTLKISQVLASTTAAPYYFSANVLPLGEKTYALMDGGLFANNPVINAICETKEVFNCHDEDILCLSIGTGYKVYNFDPQKSKDEGLLGIIPWIVNGMIDSDEGASTVLGRQCLGDRLFRFNPELTNDSLDDVSPKNIAYLEDATQAYIENNFEDIEQAAKVFKEKAPGEKPNAPREALG